MQRCGWTVKVICIADNDLLKFNYYWQNSMHFVNDLDQYEIFWYKAANSSFKQVIIN